MTEPSRPPLGAVPAFLAAVLLAVPTTAAEPPPIPPAAEYVAAQAPQPDREARIGEIEKQIADLQQKLAALRQTLPVAPAPTPKAASPVGALPEAVAKQFVWRPIGPANMGGRVTALAVVESDPSTYYVATATGGLLKTVNNGTTFTHLFDHQATGSIGDVAVAPSDPNTVWVGTGEANPRNSVSYGDGVYKSTDGGKTFTNMGLKASYQIGKIVIHPKDPNTVYVGALGRLWGPGGDRGVFKTTDGGKTWERSLFVDDKTGAIDLRMDPFDPGVLLAGMWERKRDEYDGFFGPADTWPTQDKYGPATTYGPGGGLFRTADGGKSWTRLTEEKAKAGLPTAKTGRLGVDFSTKTKGLVFAVIDTENVGKGRPSLSVYVGVTSEEAEGGGVLVAGVADDSPAAKGGLKEKDIITALDGQKIANYDAFSNYLAGKKAGDTVRVTARRDKADVTLPITLAPREVKKEEATEPKKGGKGGQFGRGGQPGKGPEGGGKGGPGGGAPPTLGIQLAPAEGAVVVGEVTPDGPAAKAGIEAGDTIKTVAGKMVTDQLSLRTVLGEFKAGDKVKVGVDRGGKGFDVEAILAAGRGGGGGGGAKGGNPNRPFLLSGDVGGQQPNVQDQQGKDGVQTGGVFASKDSGKTWERVNSLNPRPFYFSVVRTDPTDDKTVYLLGDTSLWKSSNGGARFAAGPAKGVHADHHALWIDPKDGRHMLIGCDGGFYATYDRGANWDHLNVLALGQFYHVAVDNRKPYRVFGGLQDNGSWGGPSHVLRGTGPVNDDWLFLNGGDGFVCRVDPTDPDLVYFESQNGFMGRRNLRTGEQARFGAQPVVKGEPLRFNWNTPFILSSHNPSIVYCGAQYVFRSVNKGAGMKAASPELTRTAAGSMTAIAESPKSPDVLWAGTDDGFVWVTKDGGLNWSNVTEKLKAAGLPGFRCVASLEPSRTKEGRCYVCLDGHRSDDDKPYLFVTDDLGQTWQSIAANLPEFGSTRVLREDYTNPEVLYCGTEFGAWATVNRGKGWAQINNNLPTVAVHEFAQPTTASEIVVATHGRSLWVLDVASLRQMSPRTEKSDDKDAKVDPLTAPATLFAPPAATRWRLETGRASPYSIDVRKFYGTNPDRRVALEYLLTKEAKDVSLKVLDVGGKLVREFRTTPKEPGFHRAFWDMTRAAGGGGGGGGQLVPAGSYRIVLTVDGKEFAQSVTVENDPHADPRAIVVAGGDVVRRDDDEDEDDED
ncbi:MAG TPA: PDZ domain-containing protein [Urbifossiella sp.]|nr:PDZ domain-containing protein [Urbifossiella sp.]